VEFVGSYRLWSLYEADGGESSGFSHRRTKIPARATATEMATATATEAATKIITATATEKRSAETK